MPTKSLLEPDGVFQNHAVSVGVKITRLPDGRMRLAVLELNYEAVVLLDASELAHLIRILSSAHASANSEKPSP